MKTLLQRVKVQTPHRSSNEQKFMAPLSTEKAMVPLSDEAVQAEDQR
jgi:hypothetical protein